MEYRLATDGDRHALTLLWNQVFGDSAAFIHQCLNSFAGAGHVYVAREQGTLQAQLLAVPCTIGGERGVYLYALATRPSARGAGVMSGLLAFAEHDSRLKGARFAALIPAAPPLFGFYSRRGYWEATHLRHLTWERYGETTGEVSFNTITPEGFLALRRRFCPDGLVFTVGREAVVLQDIYAQGGTAQTEQGYAVYIAGQGKVLVPELFATGYEEADTLLRAICGQCGVSSAQVTLPLDSPLYFGQGVSQPFAMVKGLDERFEALQPYIRLAMEEFVL